MKLKRILSIAVCVAILLSTTSCMSIFSKKKYDENTVSESSTSEATSPRTEYGNETVGWLVLDDSFFDWYTPGCTETCVQYAKSPTEIITLDVLDCTQYKEETGNDMDAYTLANYELYMREQDSLTRNTDKLTGAREALGEYDAYQVYCYFPDEDKYLVMWYLDSPDKTKVYNVGVEFRSSEMNFYNYALTYIMPNN